ncbi:MAG: ferredoxin [Cyanobacterium sp. T60_A2020_053]|nr:ferredoxin [Cyanobacterium sp. T60_A2020_053]
MSENIQQIVQKLHLDKIERHIFLCCDQAKPKCCSREDSLESWQYLKQRLKELGIHQPSSEYNTCVFRTKADCLRVCCDGPILLVYPDGVWYRHATPEVIELIIQQHLLKNEVVEEYLFHSHSLPSPK